MLRSVNKFASTVHLLRNLLPRRWPLAVVATALAACATPVPDASVNALAQALQRQPVVLLGEVHDNAAQHDLRRHALEHLLQGGARPALAFEQLDHDRQLGLDGARRRPAMDWDRSLAMVKAAGGRGWNWDYYRPYIELALKYDLPVVAANLSREQALRVGRDGPAAVFPAEELHRLGLDHIDPALLQAQENEMRKGHCGRVPQEMLPQLALAQVARDAVLADSIAPYADRGVILLTGNGHARRDIGVVRHLAPDIAARTISIGLLEREPAVAAGASPAPGAAAPPSESVPAQSLEQQAQAFDVALATRAQERDDPCSGIRVHPRAAPPPPPVMEPAEPPETPVAPRQ